MEGSDQGVTVRMPEATFTFDQISYRGSAMEAMLSVWRSSPDDPLEALDWQPGKVFKYHISAHSLSNVTAYRRELEKFHGNGVKWQELLHEAILTAESEYKERAQSLDPRPLERKDGDSAFLLDGIFPLNRVSCVFGMGGSGKSLAVESVMCAASAGALWASRTTSDSNTLWLDYENEDEGDFAGRRQGLADGGLEFTPGSIRWMPGRGIPFTELTGQVDREMKRWHCRNLVVDSVMFACGGDPSKAEVATGFYAALAKVPVASKVLIAHTDKAENDKYPFGSIFWHNGIHGQSWFVKSIEGTGELSVAWYGRKSSNGPKQQDFAIRFGFGEYGEISLHQGDLQKVNTETGREPQIVRIKRALGQHGGLTVAELAEETGVALANCSAYMTKMHGKGEVVKLGERRWGLASNQLVTG